MSVELIKLLATLAEQLQSTIFHKSSDSINGINCKIADISSKDKIANKGLLVEAQKLNCGISTTNNNLSMSAEAFVKKYKLYNIPVAVVGKNDKQTIEFLDRDKDVIDQITKKIMQERFKKASKNVKCFTIMSQFETVPTATNTAGKHFVSFSSYIFSTTDECLCRGEFSNSNIIGLHRTCCNHSILSFC